MSRAIDARRVAPGAAAGALALLGLVVLVGAAQAPPAPPPAGAGDPAGPSSAGPVAPSNTPPPAAAEDPAEAPADPAALAERLARYRNLGKAFYENPTTQYEAVEWFEKALALAPDSPRERLNYGLALLRAGKSAAGRAELERVQREAPEIPHTWFNLGILHQRASRFDEATAQFRRMVELVPDEPVSRYNLGTLHQLAGEEAAALAEYETAARLDPSLAAPHFRLYNLYRRAGRADEAERELAAFRALKESQEGAAAPEDMEWSFYAEIYDPPAPAPPAPPAVPAAFAPRELAGRLDGATAGLAVLDADGDGRPDLLAWSASGIALYAGGATPVEASGLEDLAGVVAAAPGDFDDDGRPDLCVIAAAGAAAPAEDGAADPAAPTADPAAPAAGGAPRPLLFANRGGRFERVEAALPAGRFDRAVWLDFDHDYDLDLVLLGADAALARNQGAGGWGDATARFPFVAGRATGAALLDLVADTQGFDLAVAYAGRPGVLYRDRLGGRYEAVELPALPAGAHALVAADVDRDGWTDLAAVAPGRPGSPEDPAGGAGEPAGVGPAEPEGPGAPAGGEPATTLALLLNRREPRGALAAAPGSPAAPPVAPPLVFADLTNRGASELVAGDRVWGDPGLGEGRPAAGAVPPGWPAAALAAADFDGDGRVDLAAAGRDGRLRLLGNATAGGGRWLAVGLAGVKNAKLAAGAEIEVKAGALYQKRLYRGVPEVFGLGAHPEADAVRITWPNGLIQNETREEAGRAVVYREAPRLSGSCPMIFTWNGERFEFVTDVLGVAPLGASAGDGTYFPVDHDEVVQIPAGALVEAGGRYEVRITEELREVSYLDAVRLIALDHPAEVEIFTNDKFKGPPFPEFRLFGVERRIYPVAARDHAGRDVLPRLTARDRAYPDGFRRDAAGVAELHHLDLDFGRAAPDGRALLVLSGWVDWADGSTFLAAAQASPDGLVMPYLQVKDAAGRWRTAIADLGMPAGKPKTIVVDLTGKFLSASREVRIVTSLCVFWDEIFLSEETGEPRRVATDLAPAAADLRFRGFSRPVIDPERRQPEAFDYGGWSPVAMWNPTPGLYTRYGEVAELLATIDDRLVILGSGDEVALSYDAGALPPLPAGWRRDLLLLVDGWAKDGDANTAHSQTVEPLPFHGMTRYPYPPDERFPDGPVYRRWRETYNTRPALRLLRPLRAERDDYPRRGETR